VSYGGLVNYTENSSKKTQIMIIPEELLLELRANDQPSGVIAAE
jgi:hypothetical protein